MKLDQAEDYVVGLVKHIQQKDELVAKLMYRVEKLEQQVGMHGYEHRHSFNMKEPHFSRDSSEQHVHEHLEHGDQEDILEATVNASEDRVVLYSNE